MPAPLIDKAARSFRVFFKVQGPFLCTAGLPDIGMHCQKKATLGLRVYLGFSGLGVQGLGCRCDGSFGSEFRDTGIGFCSSSA